MAAGLAGITGHQTIGRRVLDVTGLFLIVTILVRSVPIIPEGDLAFWDRIVPSINVALVVFLIIPACYLLSRNTLASGSVDNAVLVYLAAECVVVTILSRASTGAWVNYGIQAVVFASILTARALDRACDFVPSMRGMLPLVMAALVVVCNVIVGVRATAGTRLYHRLALARVFEHYRRPTSEFFFLNRPGYNRVYGQHALVFDDWLYPVFESIHLAEPRSVWLTRALADDGINYVVTTSDSSTIDGLGRSFHNLGYVPGIEVGPFRVWERAGFLSPPR